MELSRADLEQAAAEISILRSELTSQINSLALMIKTMSDRQEELIQSHNAVGENVQWLTANTQGIFQMLNDPRMMSQLMGSVLGGKANVGRPEE